MKKTYLVMLFALMYISAKAQDYIATGDSCFKAKNYICAAKNYDLFLKKVESRSNQIAYRSARSWSLAGDKERAIAAVKKYVANNYKNNYIVFSDELLKEKAFDLIKDDARWKEIVAAVIAKELVIMQEEKRILDSTITFQNNLEKEGILNKLMLNNYDALTTYNNIKSYNAYPAIKQEFISMQFKLTDSLHTSFLMVLPPDYDARKKYPLMFYLHGGVMMNTGYPDYISAKTTTGRNRYYTKYAKLNKVIMVYPAGNKDYNWMYPDKGFFMIPAILKQIKQVVNIDDNRVFISGHSNGATGSFSYAMKQPTPFAGFYGFNTRPRVATGGTYIKNILNRSFFNVSVDMDYYYPPEAHDSLNKVMKDIHADYEDNRYNGFSHSFPQFDESEPAYKLLFTDLDNRRRDPFHSTINWECDDVKYGRCDWISITALDTTAAKAAWQTQINFRINKWIVLDKKNKLRVRDTVMNGFNYKKSSGAIKASYSDNAFRVETSDIRSIRLYISPEMVNINTPITIMVNGRQYFNGKLNYDKAFMIDEFEKTLDKAAIWVNHIDIDLSEPSKL